MIRLSFIILFLALYGCYNNSEIIQSDNLKEIESYHCYPYNVRVYEAISVEYKNFVEYPIDDFCSDNEDAYLNKWVEFTKLSRQEQNNWKRQLNKCNNNISLITAINRGDTVYFSGCYVLTKTRKNSKVKRHYKVNFFNKDSLVLHVFKNLDYYPFF
jgi:hypothetical protein